MEQFSLHLKSSRAILTSMLLVLTILTNAQPNLDSALPQYLYPAFSLAILKMKNGNSQTSEMNYNMVTGNMVFIRDGKLYNLINTEIIDTVYLQNSEFVHFGKAFYEIILAAPIPLFLQNKGNLKSAGKPAGYDGTSETSSIATLSGISIENIRVNLKLPPDLIVKVDRIYWVRKDNNMLSFMNMKQFLKIFPGKEVEFKEYIKKNHIKIERRNDLIKLMSYCNDIITVGKAVCVEEKK